GRGRRARSAPILGAPSQRRPRARLKALGAACRTLVAGNAHGQSRVTPQTSSPAVAHGGPDRFSLSHEGRPPLVPTVPPHVAPRARRARVLRSGDAAGVLRAGL